MALENYDLPPEANLTDYSFIDEEWMSEGACYLSYPPVDMIVIGRGATADPLIREYCDNCPVVPECAAFALRWKKSMVMGIWGGVYVPIGKDRGPAYRALEEAAASLSQDAA